MKDEKKNKKKDTIEESEKEMIIINVGLKCFKHLIYIIEMILIIYFINNF